MKCLSLMAGGFVVLAAVSSLPASAQFQIATAGRDYSFTISTAQPWTDTGVDLQTGDVLQIHSSSGGDLRPGGSERRPKHRPARGFCSCRSLDRQTAAASGAGPGRQR